MNMLEEKMNRYKRVMCEFFKLYNKHSYGSETQSGTNGLLGVYVKTKKNGALLKLVISFEQPKLLT